MITHAGRVETLGLYHEVNPSCSSTQPKQTNITILYNAAKNISQQKQHIETMLI